VSIMSDEWLEESELSPEVIRLDSPSTPLVAILKRILLMLFTIRLWVSISCLRFLLDKDSFDALYNPVVDVNIISSIFARKANSTLFESTIYRECTHIDVINPKI
jgi:hypothetical protein